MAQHQIGPPNTRGVYCCGVGGVNRPQPRAQSRAQMGRPIGERVRGQEMFQHARFQFAVLELRRVG